MGIIKRLVLKLFDFCEFQNKTIAEETVLYICWRQMKLSFFLNETSSLFRLSYF